MTLFGDFTTNVPVTFQKMRALLGELEGLQEGVVGAADFKVSQRAAGGANMSVDVAAGAAYVQIDTGVRNGLSHIYSDALANVAIAAPHATLPRLDQVVAQYNDSSIPAGVGGDTPTLRVIQGTPTSGATLANRTGAAALPNDCVRKADVLVPAAAASIVNANINDRRPWARGAFRRLQRATAIAGATGGNIDSATFYPAIECSGAPLRISLRSRIASTAAATADIVPWVDGAAIDGQTGAVGTGPFTYVFAAASSYASVWSWETIPTAGRHNIGVALGVTAGSITFGAGTLGPLLVIEELVRPNADNV